MGTIAPIIGAIKTMLIADALFSKSRKQVLALLFGNTQKTYYLREIARLTGSGQGCLQRELQRLSEANIISRIHKGKLVYYQANAHCPVIEELKGLVVKTSSLVDEIRPALMDYAANIKVAFIYGSFAEGREKENSNVDIMVVGDVRFAEVCGALETAQAKIGREINPAVYPPAEFKKKAKVGQHFIKAVLRGKKIFLLGDEDELAALAEKRLGA